MVSIMRRSGQVTGTIPCRYRPESGFETPSEVIRKTMMTKFLSANGRKSGLALSESSMLRALIVPTRITAHWQPPSTPSNIALRHAWPPDGFTVKGP